MKVLALNSSARTGSHSKTELMLNHLIDGMHKAEVDMDLFSNMSKFFRKEH